MGPTENVSKPQQPQARLKSATCARDKLGEIEGVAAGNTSSTNDEKESFRQSLQFVDTSVVSVYRAGPAASSQLFHASVKTEIRSLFGASKEVSVDVLKPLLLWLFPNILVCLVFAVTLTACLLSNATIEFDLCFLLLLIASWAFLAAAAGRKGSGEADVASRGFPLLTEAASCDETRELLVRDEGDEGGAMCSDAASAHRGPPSSASEAATKSGSSLQREEAPSVMGWTNSTNYAVSALPQSDSILSLETATSRRNSRGSAGGVIWESDSGSREKPQQAVVENGPVADADNECGGPATALAAAEGAAAGIGGAAVGTEKAEADDLFPFLCEEDAAESQEERERTLYEQETEEAETSCNEEVGKGSGSADDAARAASAGSSNTELSAWLGALGEASLSSSIANLSFCRSQTLAATLSPHDQSMSVDTEDPPLPSLPVSCLADGFDVKGSSASSALSKLHTVPPFDGVLEQQQEGNPQVISSEAVLSRIVSEKLSDGVTSGTLDVGSLDNLLDEHQHQQRPLMLQQFQRYSSGSGVPSSPAVPHRRVVGTRRVGSVGGKMQRRESRAALQYYMGLVKDCCKRRDGAGALKVLEEVQREGKVAPDVQLLNYVLFACVASQDAFLTKRLFEFIEGAGVADIVTYNTMLKSFSLSGQLEEAEKILRRMRGRNVPPDEVSFNLLVNAAVSCGRIDRAWHYVDELKSAHMVVDVCEDLILLSTCIDATLRLGDTERLRRLLDRFEGSSLSPNAHAYGTLIKAYGRLGNLSRVWGLWRDLQTKKNMEPTNYTYGCMLDILLSNNLLADATQLFCRMVQQGVVDAVHFSILVKGLSKYNEQGVRLALEAYSVLQNSTAFRRTGAGEGGGGKGNHGREVERSHSKVALNTISFNALLHLCVVNGRMDDALRLFHDMERQDTVAPDLISYSTVIKGLCCCPGDAPLERALSLLDQMQKRYGIRPDAIVFNTLIQGAATRKNPALVEHLLSLMQQSNVPPSSYTLCQCVKLYGKCNNLQRALELANELPSRFGFTIDGYVYTALIAACMSNGATVLAGQLAYQATSSGIEIPPGVLCRLWDTLHFARATQQEGMENDTELNAVYESIWKLVGPQSKDPSTVGLEGIGVRRSRRRGGKQHANSSIRPRQQQSSTNSCNVGSGHQNLEQPHIKPLGVINNAVLPDHRDWEGLTESPILLNGEDQSEMDAAARWCDTGTDCGVPFCFYGDG